MQSCTCPYCRCPLRYSQLRHDPAVQSELDALQVACPNTGCTATMARGHVSDHLAAECPMQPLACAHCGYIASRRDLEAHPAQCPDWPVPCTNAAGGCTVLVPTSALEHHLRSDCQWQAAPCSGCGQRVARRDWRQHALRDCPARRDCPGRVRGCGFVGSEDQLQQHLAGGCGFATAEAGAAAAAPGRAAAAVPDNDGGCLPQAELAFAQGGYTANFGGEGGGSIGSSSSSMETDAAPPTPQQAAAAVVLEAAPGSEEWEDYLELGLPGCAGRLGIEGVMSDEATDAAWRAILNFGLIEVRPD